MMRIHIHRGQNQIGGSIVEVSIAATRLFFDVGINLDDADHAPCPDVPGLFSGTSDCQGVFLSHYHSDHIGLIAHVLPGIPVYMGKHAYTVYCASAHYRSQPVPFDPIIFEQDQPLHIGDIDVTPIRCDHSAFDSYMFLLAHDGEKILYTGDFRANGRMCFTDTLAQLPTVDAVIVEGTTLSRDTYEQNLREDMLEVIATDALRERHGPAFLLASAMNVERIVTGYHVSQSTGRLFLEDIYTADILSAADDTYPKPDRSKQIRVFMTGGDQQYKRLQSDYNSSKIGKDGIAQSSFLMCVRSSMKNYLAKLNEKVDFTDGILFYGMWKGYKEQPQMRDFLSFMEDRGVKLHTLHTSGHADLQTIDALIQTVQPKLIVPVHTENPEWFNRYEIPVLLDSREAAIGNSANNSLRRLDSA